MAGSHFQLPFDQVKASHFFSDTVLNLEAGVHLHEVELVRVSVKDEFNRTSVGVVHGLGCGNGGIAHLLSKSFADIGRRFLNNLLMASLNGAVSLVHVDVISMFVSENLELDMPGVGHELLNDHVVVAESSHGFSLSSFECFIEVSFSLDNAHSFTTST